MLYRFVQPQDESGTKKVTLNFLMLFALNQVVKLEILLILKIHIDTYSIT